MAQTPSGLPITLGAFQPLFQGSSIGLAGHLGLLPDNVVRRGCATPHCAGVPLFEVGRKPVAGQSLGFLMGNAPPSAAGVLLLGIPSQAPWLQGCGLELWTQPVFCFGLASDRLGTAAYTLNTLPAWAGILFGAQTVWLPTAACPGGLFGCSAAALEVQL